MIENYYKEIGDNAFNKIDAAKPGSWLYVKEASLEDLGKISQLTGIDILDIKDSLDPFELPRIEQFDNNIIFFVRHPDNSEQGQYTETLTIILTNDYVIAISAQKSEIIEGILASNLKLSTTQRAKLILHILLRVTQSFTANVKRIRQSILTAEPHTATIGTTDITWLTKHEEILNQYLTSLVSMRNLLETVAASKSITFYEADLDLLEDLMIATRQSEEVCSVNLKSIRSQRDAYHIIFTMDVNRTIKFLTAITIIVTIPTVIASIYGMNVHLPFADLPYSFFLIMAFTIFLSIIGLFLFRKKNWL